MNFSDGLEKNIFTEMKNHYKFVFLTDTMIKNRLPYKNKVLIDPPSNFQ